MAECRNCGAEKNSRFIVDGLCPQCRSNTGSGKSDYAEFAQRRRGIEAVMLTTETYSEGLSITKRIEVVTAECAFGMNIFKDLFAGVRNVVGGRSEAVQKTLRDTRRTALYELKKEAYEVGANAVVGVDLDYVELAATGSTMVMLVASGTAVRIEESESRIPQVVR